jgi:hypothetical protein
MGTAGTEYAYILPIEPGDTQARLVVVVPVGCLGKSKVRAIVEREGEAPISEELAEAAA